MVARVRGRTRGSCVADIFREIDDELRREGLANLWRRYGPFIIGLAVIIILGVAGYSAWDYYSHQRQIERSRAYAAAIAAIDKEKAAAIPALEDLASGEDGYAALAHLQAAALEAKAGKTEDAITIYRNLAADTGIDLPFRNLATILMAAHGLGTMTPEETTALLEPLTGPANPWRFSARELLALSALRGDDRAKAVELYQELADDLEAPPGLRARAAEMLKALQA